jgi:ABC-type glycerol-3-phosphate transport system substrate-binding protein
VRLTFWFWGEVDAPGSNAWIASAVDAYEASHPGVTIDIVEQPTNQLVAAFGAAAAAREGPDIASQWATAAVLTQGWSGAITPISDLVPPEELAHWRFTGENTAGGKVWAAPLYVMGVPWLTNLRLLADVGIRRPPGTWDELLRTCRLLRARGITPIALGRDAVFTVQLMVQSLDSSRDLVRAISGDAQFTDRKYAEFEDAWQQARDQDCFGDDQASVDHELALAQFSNREAAMTVAQDGYVARLAQDIQPDRIAVSRWPVFGHGALRHAHSGSQSTGFFVTSWSKHKQEAADFLVFLHSAAMRKSLYEMTGSPPADDRFDPALLSDGLARELYALDTNGPQAFMLNNFPAEIEIHGNWPAQQLLLAEGGDGAAAAAVRERAARAWRAAHPDEVARWRTITPAW